MLGKLKCCMATVLHKAAVFILQRTIMTIQKSLIVYCFEKDIQHNVCRFQVCCVWCIRIWWWGRGATSYEIAFFPWTSLILHFSCFLLFPRALLILSTYNGRRIRFSANTRIARSHHAIPSIGHGKCSFLSLCSIITAICFKAPITTLPFLLLS